MNKGFVPLMVIAIVSLVGILTAGGAYTVYKVNQLQEENKSIKTELQEQKQEVIDTSVQGLVKKSNNDESSLKVYYVVSTTNVRECASTNCKILFTLRLNHEIKSAYQQLEFMPEWIDVSFDDGVVGYINKITLSEKKTEFVDKSNTTEQVTVEKSENSPQIKDVEIDKYDWDEISKSVVTVREKREYYEKQKEESVKRLNDMDGSKDIYVKWSPIISGTLAESIAQKGYEQAVAVATSEYEISKELGQIIGAINATLLIIENKDEKKLVESINNYRTLEEKYLISYTKHVATYRTAVTTLTDFGKALESLGYKMN